MIPGCTLPLTVQLEMVNAEIKAGGGVGFGIRLQVLRKQRDAIEDALDEQATFESERGHDEDGCEEYARRFAAV